MSEVERPRLIVVARLKATCDRIQKAGDSSWIHYQQPPRNNGWFPRPGHNLAGVLITYIDSAFFRRATNPIKVIPTSIKA